MERGVSAMPWRRRRPVAREHEFRLVQDRDRPRRALRPGVAAANRAGGCAGIADRTPHARSPYTSFPRDCAISHENYCVAT